MFETAGEKLRQYKPRRRLVRTAQIDLLLYHTRFQTMFAPIVGLFLVVAFAGSATIVSAISWIVLLWLSYGVRIVVKMRLGRRGAGKLGERLKIYLIGLAGAGFLWAAAPHVIAPNGSDAQMVVGIFVGIAVLVGIVGNFLYYQSALVYFTTWVVPALVSLGVMYVDRFDMGGWTYIGIVLVFLAYCYKCLQVINLPLGETLELNEALQTEKERAVEADRTKSHFLAMMSHELRTPLTAITGYSEIIRDRMFGPNLGDRYRESAASICNAAGLLTDLISDLLDLRPCRRGGGF
jgi:signal transduction histidine kinase